MEMFSNLGRTLGLLRELRGKSQARVAREAGIGKSQLSKYEKGQSAPTLEFLLKLKTHSGRSFDWIVSGEEVLRATDSLPRVASP